MLALLPCTRALKVSSSRAWLLRQHVFRGLEAGAPVGMQSRTG